ncbi:MAG: cytochrome C, partial [Sphingobacterium sp.]
SPAQIAQVASYIVTLRDTHPANPKEAQGEEITYGNAEDAAQPNDGTGTEKEAE